MEIEQIQNDMNEFNIKDWDKKKAEIVKQSEHSRNYWGFDCLKNATKLKYDIGDKVYLTFGEEVKKVIIVSVNSFSVCMVKLLPVDEKDNTLITSHINHLYKNVYYALLESRANYLINQKEK